MSLHGSAGSLEQPQGLTLYQRKAQLIPSPIAFIEVNLPLNFVRVPTNLLCVQSKAIAAPFSNHWRIDPHRQHIVTPSRRTNWWRQRATASCTEATRRMLASHSSGVVPLSFL